MSKKDNAYGQVDGGFEPSIDDEAEKFEAFKLKKKESAKAWAERKRQEKAERAEKAKRLVEIMQGNGSFDKLDGELQNFVLSLANPSKGGSSTIGNGSTFAKMFGDNPQVGQSVTLKDAFNNTLKGKSALDAYAKRWAEKGIVVSFKQNDSNILDSTYTIESLGA